MNKELIEIAVLDNHFTNYGDRSYAEVMQFLKTDGLSECEDDWLVQEFFSDWYYPALADHIQSIVDSVLNTETYQSITESRNNG